MTHKYPENLFVGMDEKDKAAAFDLLKYSPLIQNLRDIFTAEKDKSLPSIVDYDCPSWSHKQAHLNGKAEAFRQILKFLGPKEV